jgi:hypothetical protein
LLPFQLSQSGWLQRSRRGWVTSLYKTTPCNQDDSNGSVLLILLVEGSTVSGLKQGAEGNNARVSQVIKKNILSLNRNGGVDA